MARPHPWSWTAAPTAEHARGGGGGAGGAGGVGRGPDWDEGLLRWWREQRAHRPRSWYYGAYDERDLRRILNMRDARLVAGWERLRYYEQNHGSLEGGGAGAGGGAGGGAGAEGMEGSGNAALVLVVLMALMLLVQVSERCFERIMKRRRGCREAREPSVRWDPEQNSNVSSGPLPTIEDVSSPPPSPPPYLAGETPPPEYPGPALPKPSDAPPAYDAAFGGAAAGDAAACHPGGQGGKPDAEEPPPPYSACYVALKDKDNLSEQDGDSTEGQGQASGSDAAVLEVTTVGTNVGAGEQPDTCV